MNKQPHNYGSISTPAVEFGGGSGSSEFNSLCDGVVTNIYTINSSLKSLENGLKSLGTKKDNQGLRNNIHVTQLSTNQIASVTTKDLNKLKLLVSKGEKQKQLQVEKLEGNFKEAINRYYTLQKEVANKQKAHLLVAVSIEHEGSPDEEYGDLQQQKQAQVAREMAFEQDMLLEREERIRQIESDVLDVNQIMRELGSMVYGQAEIIDNVENNVDRAAGNLEEGTEQLIKASSYQNRYRRKLVYLVLICIIITAILIGIIVAEVK